MKRSVEVASKVFSIYFNGKSKSQVIRQSIIGYAELNAKVRVAVEVEFKIVVHKLGIVIRDSLNTLKRI